MTETQYMGDEKEKQTVCSPFEMDCPPTPEEQERYYEEEGWRGEFTCEEVLYGEGCTLAELLADGTDPW